MTEANIKSVLQGLDFCQDMNDAEVSQLAAVSHCEDFQRGDILFHEGDPATELYLIVSGEVALSANAPRLGRRHVMSVGPGDLVGWSPVLERSRMTATARAVAPSRLLIIRGPELLQLCHDNPTFGYNFMRCTAKTLADRLAATRLELLHFHGVNLPEAVIESD